MHLSFMDEDTKIIASTNYHAKTLILLNCLTKLLICRDAYWKIAGEEMGLGKPWKPNWTNNDEFKFVIGVCENKITKNYSKIAQYVLAFPTEEM